MCVVDLLPRRPARAGRLGPARPARLALHAERAELLAEAGGDHPAFVALSTATSQVVNAPPYGRLADAELDLYRRLDDGPALLVPLVFHGAPLGVVSLARPGRHDAGFIREDVAVAEAVAHQISAAVSAERLLEEHRNVSGLLQRTLLPRSCRPSPASASPPQSRGRRGRDGRRRGLLRRHPAPGRLVDARHRRRVRARPGAAAMTGVVRHTLRGLVAHEIDLASAIADSTAGSTRRPTPGSSSRSPPSGSTSPRRARWCRPRSRATPRRSSSVTTAG